MVIYETYQEAEKNVMGDATIIPVTGGYGVVKYDEYRLRIRDEAASLYDGGWRAEDGEELVLEYCTEENDATDEWKESVVAELERIEEENKK